MAADNGILIGWNRIVPGKEPLGVALFGEALEFWREQQRAGAIDSFETVFLGPHGGDLNGFILVRGEAEKLNQVLVSDAYLVLETKANYLLQGHGVIKASFGEEITRRMGFYQRAIAGS